MKIKYKGWKIKIEQDDIATSPREFAGEERMLCAHRRFQLGDKHDYSPEEILKLFTKARKYITLELYLYDHSIQYLRPSLPAAYLMSKGEVPQLHSNPFIGNAQHAEWDSGLVGVITISREMARHMFNWKRLNKARIYQVYDYLVSVVAEYDQWMRGEVYWYEIRDPEGNHWDSCGGMYGLEYVQDHCKSLIDNAQD